MALIDIPGFPGMSVMDCGFGNERLEHSQNYRPFHPEKGLKYWPQTIWWKLFLRQSCALPIVASTVTERCTFLMSLRADVSVQAKELSI